MLAAFIEKYGSDQVLSVAERPRPMMGENDILVKIHAASVNPVDFKLRDGKLKFLRSLQFPLILGHDCSGEVIEVGHLVSKFKVGDRIFSRPRSLRIGTFAEYIAIDQSEAAPMPLNLSFSEAAGIPLVGLTSWQALVDVAKVRPGQKVFIHAGAGGIGTFAIQLAKYLGAEVWTTTSAKNTEFVKGLGADHIINYQTEDFTDKAKDMDVVFDTLGGETLKKSFAIIKPGGWVVSISGAADHRTARDLELNFLKSLVLGAFGLATNLRALKHRANYRFIFMKPLGKQLEKISTLLTTGTIKPHIDKVFPLAESQSALKYSEAGRARGKIIVQVVNPAR